MVNGNYYSGSFWHISILVAKAKTFNKIVSVPIYQVLPAYRGRDVHSLLTPQTYCPACELSQHSQTLFNPSRAATL